MLLCIPSHLPEGISKLLFIDFQLLIYFLFSKFISRPKTQHHEIRNQFYPALACARFARKPGYRKMSGLFTLLAKPATGSVRIGQNKNLYSEN
jgi:hypothetical protein